MITFNLSFSLLDLLASIITNPEGRSKEKCKIFILSRYCKNTQFKKEKNNLFGNFVDKFILFFLPIEAIKPAL